MIDFIRRWHPLLFLIAGIYLAIPKPAPNPAEIDREFLERYDQDGSGYVTRDEYDGPDFDALDINNDGRLTIGSRFRWPLHEFRMNLGQDLKGGSSLRYNLVQQDMVDAEQRIRELLAPMAEYMDRISDEGRSKFGRVIEGGELRPNEWASEDYQSLIVAGVFDEGRADALRRFYTTWNDAVQRRDADDLVEPTIETLNRRLGNTGITELNIAPLGENRLEVRLPEFATRAETERYKQLLETTGALEMRVLASEDSEFVNLEVGEYPRDEGYRYRWLPLAREDATSGPLVKERDGRQYVPVLIIDDYDITGRDLTNIQPSTARDGGMAVTFDLRGLAVARFENLTRRHKVATAGGEDPRLLAIVIDDQVYSAYNIQDTISGSVQLTGRFTARERDDIINVLRSGSLNVQLRLEGEETVGPSEGAEAVRRGLYSLILGGILVVFMALLIYRGLGVLTVINLVIVLVLLMGAMAAGLGTLTMPGIAGIVLTIGMAIDANILINERIREEREKGLNTRGSIDEGFRHAMSAIIDANVTTLLTALILYKIGSGPIQGFALTLALGICATLYTALAAYRAMLSSILSIKRDAKFNMAGLAFFRNRTIDWLSYWKIGVIGAVILVLAGGSFIVTHGAEILGIEFRGGHTFRIQLQEAKERDEVADLLVDESTGQARFEWAENIEIQPVYRLGAGFGAGVADRYDLRFPMRGEWRQEDPEVITARLRAHIEEVLGDLMVQEGWVVTPIDVRETTFVAHLDLRLKDPEEFRERYPDDYDVLWLARDRAWTNNPNAPRENRERWFGEINPTTVDWQMTPSATGDLQRYTLRLEGISIADEAEHQRKFASFQTAVARWFYEDSQTIDLDSDPRFEDTPTRAGMEVRVSFLESVDVETFRNYVEGLPVATSGILRTADLTVTPVDSDATETNQFFIRSSELAFSADPLAEDHISAFEGALNDAIVQWLIGGAGGEANEISERFLLSSAIGATVASEAQWRALFAILAALVIVVIYIRIRFASVGWGMAAVVALLHDSFVVVGLIGLVDYFGADIKIDLTVVAAILTVIGYSLNDTIVNFDRIRENLKNDRLATGGKTPLKDIINTSINQMLSRTVMTSGTTLMTTIAMLIFGGPLLKGFAFAMTCGIIVGTFSSIYIAGPVLLWFDKRGDGSLLDLTEEEKEQEEAIKAEKAAEGQALTDETAGESEQDKEEEKKEDQEDKDDDKKDEK
jgi:protein-export membrane protein SecD/preprotein translocase SecF subunit